MVDLTDPTFWVPNIIALALVVITYVDMRRRLREDEKASQAMLKLIAAFREEASSKGNLSQQQLALRERELKMKEAMNTVKTIKSLAETARTLGLLDEN